MRISNEGGRKNSMLTIIILSGPGNWRDSLCCKTECKKENLNGATGSKADCSRSFKPSVDDSVDFVPAMVYEMTITVVDKTKFTVCARIFRESCV